VSTQPKLQPDPFEQLKATLEDSPRSYGFLSEYVKALEWQHHEEDIFTRLAFENASAGGASHGRSSSVVVSILTELYEPLDADQKLEIRNWWHEMVRGKANQFNDLKSRLTRLA
jgi:hypothetical protein